MTREQLRDWLLGYAWAGTPDEQAREVECILTQPAAQDHVIEGRQEKYRGMVENPGDPKQISEADGFVLSALYECHEGPHLSTCPAVTGRTLTHS